MTEIHALDLKGHVAKAVTGVFETMLSMALAPEAPPNRESVTTGEHVVGTVGFAGKVMGNVSVFVGRDFAREMTAAMLGVSADEVESDEEINDVIGEVCNMVGGDLKSRLCDAGFSCQLTIPSITIGDEFRIESMDWMRHEQLCFRHQEHLASVEVFIKSAT